MAKPPPRLWTDETLSDGVALSLPKEQAHYLGTVLRLSEGATVLFFNGRDGEWQVRLEAISRKGGIAVPVTHVRAQAASPDITLLFAPLKKGPTDLLVQKSTELGARHLAPVLTARTITHRLATDRLALIATEAAEQCERLDVPTISAPQKLAAALASMADRPLLFCDEAADHGSAGGQGAGPAALWDRVPLTKGPWALLAGPEGGFSPEERDDLLARENVHPISLGPRILKAETAALAALTLWQARFGDMG